MLFLIFLGISYTNPDFNTVITLPIIEEIVYRGVGYVSEKMLLELIDYIKNEFSWKITNTDKIKTVSSFIIRFMVTTFFSLHHTLNCNYTKNKFLTIFQVINCYFATALLYSIQDLYGFKYAVVAHILNNYFAVCTPAGFVTLFYGLIDNTKVYLENSYLSKADFLRFIGLNKPEVIDEDGYKNKRRKSKQKRRGSSKRKSSGSIRKM